MIQFELVIYLQGYLVSQWPDRFESARVSCVPVPLQHCLSVPSLQNFFVIPLLSHSCIVAFLGCFLKRRVRCHSQTLHIKSSQVYWWSGIQPNAEFSDTCMFYMNNPGAETFGLLSGCVRETCPADVAWNPVDYSTTKADLSQFKGERTFLTRHPN